MHESPQRVLRLNEGWRFHLGGEGKPLTEIDPPLANTHLAAYINNKAGYALGAAKTNYDDSDWRTVDLPHDWSVEGEFSPDNHLDAGYLPRGVGWYRKYFRLEESDRGKHLSLNFDGVATHCTVNVNGHLLHRNFCGSSPFTIDLTDVATFGDTLNTIAVKVDATWMEGWWYEGAGIYRNVWLVKTNASHIAPDGICIRTSLDGWVEACVDVCDNRAPAGRGATRTPRQTLLLEVVSPTGAVICKAQGDEWFGDMTFQVTRPQLWSCESPNLYTLRTTLLEDGNPIDRIETRFGFRTIRFDADTGFFLNDQHTFLKGVCLHQDHAGVGVAVPESIERFRLLQMKSIGVNAIRCAHNPPSRTFLDLCDELGFLVMNEVRNFGSSPEHLRQLEAVVRRDRNHPCIILWSICNEEAIQGSPVAANIARSMIDHLRALDPTRPITGAVSGGIMDDVGLAPLVGSDDARTFDVMSINYNLPLHDAYHQKYPRVPMIVSETGCTYATRGVETTDKDKHHFAEDDSAFAPWGASARATWEHVRARSYLAGMFVWTGIDYRGEPTPHEWPSVQSHWGLFDLCCFPKRAARLHESFFTGQSERNASHRTSDLVIELPKSIRVWGSQLPIVADDRFTLPLTIKSPQDETITIEIDGPARLIGVGNGDPTSHVNKGNRITTFNGLAQALVQMKNEAGRIIVSVSGASGTRSAIHFNSTLPAHSTPHVPVVFPRHLVTGWRMSPITDSAPDPNVVVSDQDMNTWERIDPRVGVQSAWARAQGYALYRARLTLPKSMQTSGCTIRFHRLLGKAEAFIDGTPTSLRDTGAASFELDYAGSTTSRTLTIRLRSSAPEAGLTGLIELLPHPADLL